jgi:hypothetical protein
VPLPNPSANPVGKRRDNNEKKFYYFVVPIYISFNAF